MVLRINALRSWSSMFISYNLVEFGDKLKSLRKELGLSQTDIQDNAGVSVDALRRIEKGEVIPRYETLELLSSIYKQDLLELLKSCRNNKLLTEYHDELDSIIVSYDNNKIQALEADIRKSFTDSERSTIVNPNEVIQLLLFIRGTTLHHSRISNDHKDSLNILLDALRLTIPKFQIHDFKVYNYSYIELRILLLLSVLVAEDENYEIGISTKILYFILEKLSNNSTSKYIDQLIVKIYSNLAYNYHLQDKQKNVIEISNVGIEYCLKHEMTHILYLLYYRKGIAEYKLKQKNYLESLYFSFFMLKITKQYDLLDVYLEVTKQKYNIDVPILSLDMITQSQSPKKTS